MIFCKKHNLMLYSKFILTKKEQIFIKSFDNDNSNKKDDEFSETEDIEENF